MNSEQQAECQAIGVKMDLIKSFPGGGAFLTDLLLAIAIEAELELVGKKELEALRRGAISEPWLPIKTAPPDDEASIIVRLSKNSVAPGHVIRIRRGMLADRPGPNHLRVFADWWMPYIEPPTSE